ncbi:DUF2158 domain-containing protein [Pseudomonas aeruginosa]|uniref:DUF2158 domain-containing protein n=1 Tax=Pseudomonas aeruginosa TaxID=287 RepID=UPI0033074335
MTDLKKGELVQLKSGGPKMVVDNLQQQRDFTGESLYPPGLRAHCTWFDEKNEPRGEWFDVETLVRVE